jgi:zinc D-Ala-D-Ala carboxypeptidase
MIKDRIKHIARLNIFKGTPTHIFLLLLIFAYVGYSEYSKYTLSSNLKEFSKTYQENSQSLASTTDERFQIINARLDSLLGQNAMLEETVKGTNEQNRTIVDQVNNVSGLIGSLDKLSKTDPQLLQKYSKVFFLNEHYVPESLTAINPKYTFNKKIEYKIHSQVHRYLEGLLTSAEQNGLSLLVISAYRSFDTQADLKSHYKTVYGAGTANQFSADQGYSEHQLGTAVDFTTATIGSTYNGFDKSAEYEWLKANAHKFGFILSYPEGNQHYVFEPWHWRYVGVDLATRLHSEGKYFYDFDQRVINTYLLRLFE